MSNIDITKPIQGTPTTQSVRDNFAAAATEIDSVTALTGVIDSLVIEAYQLNVVSGSPLRSIADSYNVNQAFGYIMIQQPPADNYQANFFIPKLALGNYTIEILASFGANSGILQVIHEGIIIGTMDQYAATTTYNRVAVFTFTNINLATGFLFITNGKNPLSGGFTRAMTRATVRKIPPPSG